MDFNTELMSLQGVLVSIDSKNPFQNIKSREENEKVIFTIVQLLQDYLLKRQYFDNNLDERKQDQLRNFAFYLVLNSDLEILQELVEVDDLSSVIWTAPKIPKCLLSELLWCLNMKMFIIEIIVFTHPHLSFQVVEVLLNHIKYFHPVDCFLNLQIMLNACYKFLYRLIFFHVKNIELKQAVNNFQTCLKYFKEPPNKRHFETFKKDDQYKFIYKHLYAFCETIYVCLNEYLIVHKIDLPSTFTIYELSYFEESMYDIDGYCLQDTEVNEEFKESIEICNIALLDTCVELVKEVSIEMFCAWSEYVENGISMQQQIGHLCYKLKKKLKDLPSISEHALVNMLDQISCDPIDCVKIINNLEYIDIIENIKKNIEERDKWIKAILHRNNVCNEINLIELLISNISILDEQECITLFKIGKKYITDNSDAHDKIKVLVCLAFQQCTVDNKYKLLQENFCNCYHDGLLTEQFNQWSVEIFNKLTSIESVDLSEVLVLFLQSPKKLLHKVFQYAIENGPETTNLVMGIMKYIAVYVDYYYDHETQSTLLNVTRDIMESDLDITKSLHFLQILTVIKSINLLSGTKLLLFVIMPTLYSSLLNKNINSIRIVCLLLAQLYTMTELMEYRAPLMAMLGQVLDTLRWNIETYHPLAPPTLEYCADLLTTIFQTYNYQMPEKELCWLKIKLRNINALNLYYFKELWNPPGHTFFEVITGVRIYKDMDVEQLIARLSRILCSTSMREWIQIWKDLPMFPKKRLYNIFHEAILLIATTEKKHRSEQTWACLLNCIGIFVQITKYYYLTDKINARQMQDILKKFIQLENFTDEETIESYLFKILPLLTYMIEIKGNLDISLIWNTVSGKVKNRAFFVFLNETIFNDK